MKKNFCKSITKDQVLNLAIKLVKSANSKIIVTHSEQDKSSVKPNDDYYQSLEERILNGIRVSRYYFGNHKNYTHEKAVYKNINYIYAGSTESYQRCIIIDNKKMLFKLEDSFYYSEFKPLIESLLKYLSE